MYNFLSETNNLQEANDTLIEANESVRKENKFIKMLLDQDP